MTKELELVDHYELMNQAATLYHKGITSPTKIGRELNITRAKAMELIQEWKEIAKNDTNIREQAAETLQSAIQHYDLLKDEAWKLLEQADINGNLPVKATVIKTIADIQAKAVEMLQKAGLYDDAALGDEIAEMEEKQQILVKILKEVSANCDNCKFEVARRLSKVTGKVETVEVDSRVVEGSVINPAT